MAERQEILHFICTNESHYDHMSKCFTRMLQPELFRNPFFLFSYRLRLPIDFSFHVRYILRMRQSHTCSKNDSKCCDPFLCKLNLITTFESITAMNEAEFDGREKIMYIFLLSFFAKRRQTVEKVIFQK